MSSIFHSSYAQARKAFLLAATQAGAQTAQYLHPLLGSEGEELAVDVAIIGDPDGAKRLMVSSGCHGVEGYCGSGIQIAALQDESLLERAKQAGMTLVYAHGLNPYGFSHIRRVTHENVDLNRNFVDFLQPLPQNSAYAELSDIMLPDVWPPTVDNQQALAQVVATRGLPFVQSAVSGGQYDNPKGLFFGGAAPTWSNQTFRALLREHIASAAHLGWIDIHTGLGPSGHGERICDTRICDHERASRWWGGNGKTALTSANDGTSTSTVLDGTITEALGVECPQTHVSAITLEFGTLPPLGMMQALRAEQWLQLHPEADAAMRTAIKQEFFAAFFTDTPEWKASILAQGLETIAQGLDGLAAQV